ncbi:MAG TPA: hypothetical protein PKB03_11190, partial [Baekduia sp.]|nr:hypothetical protein [Baekduia sp.]
MRDRSAIRQLAEGDGRPTSHDPVSRGKRGDQRRDGLPITQRAERLGGHSRHASVGIAESLAQRWCRRRLADLAKTSDCL